VLAVRRTSKIEEPEPEENTRDQSNGGRDDATDYPEAIRAVVQRNAPDVHPQIPAIRHAGRKIADTIVKM
jgi:hypothetical protein